MQFQTDTMHLDLLLTPSIALLVARLVAAPVRLVAALVQLFLTVARLNFLENHRTAASDTFLAVARGESDPTMYLTIFVRFRTRANPTR